MSALVTFVTGGAASGKSALAERLCARSGARPLVYVATMDPTGREARERVRRHRALRAGKGFLVVERQRDLSGVRVPADSAVLLEDLGNLAANELFAPGGDEELAFLRMRAGVESLAASCARLVVVGNDVHADGVVYDEGTAAYLRLLARANAWFCERAACAVETVFGIPVWLKGGEGA